MMTCHSACCRESPAHLQQGSTHDKGFSKLVTAYQYEVSPIFTGYVCGLSSQPLKTWHLSLCHEPTPTTCTMHLHCRVLLSRYCFLSITALQRCTALLVKHTCSVVELTIHCFTAKG